MLSRYVQIQLFFYKHQLNPLHFFLDSAFGDRASSVQRNSLWGWNPSGLGCRWAAACLNSGLAQQFSPTTPRPAFAGLKSQRHWRASPSIWIHSHFLCCCESAPKHCVTTQSITKITSLSSQLNRSTEKSSWHRSYGSWEAVWHQMMSPCFDAMRLENGLYLKFLPGDINLFYGIWVFQVPEVTVWSWGGCPKGQDSLQK